MMLEILAEVAYIDSTSIQGRTCLRLGTARASFASAVPLLVSATLYRIALAVAPLLEDMM